MFKEEEGNLRWAGSMNALGFVPLVRVRHPGIQGIKSKKGPKLCRLQKETDDGSGLRATRTCPAAYGLLLRCMSKRGPGGEGAVV